MQTSDVNAPSLPTLLPSLSTSPVTSLRSLPLLLSLPSSPSLPLQSPPSHCFILLPCHLSSISPSYTSSSLPLFIHTSLTSYSSSLPPSHSGTLYGIAHSTMAIGSGGGIVGCEGVTLLPPGSRWLSLALACLQVDTREIDQDFDEDDVLAGKSNKK